MKIELEKCVICKTWLRPNEGIKLSGGERICARPEWEECHERSLVTA